MILLVKMIYQCPAPSLSPAQLDPNIDNRYAD